MIHADIATAQLGAFDAFEHGFDGFTRDFDEAAFLQHVDGADAAGGQILNGVVKHAGDVLRTHLVHAANIDEQTHHAGTRAFLDIAALLAGHWSLVVGAVVFVVKLGWSRPWGCGLMIRGTGVFLVFFVFFGGGRWGRCFHGGCFDGSVNFCHRGCHLRGLGHGWHFTFGCGSRCYFNHRRGFRCGGWSGAAAFHGLRAWFELALGVFLLLPGTVFHDLLGLADLVLHQQVHQSAGDLRGGESGIKQALNAMLVGGVAGGFEHGFDLFEGLIDAGRLEIFLRRHLGAFDTDVDETLDALHEVNLTTGDETHGFAAAAGTTGAADAVNVVFGIVGKLQIDDEVDVVHVEAASGDIGGAKDLHSTAAEVPHHALTHRLIDVAMQAVSGITTCHEGIGGVIDGTFGVGKDDGEARGLNVDDAAEHLGLGAAMHLVVALLDGWNRERLLLDGDGGRIAGVVFDEAADARLEGGAEENRLALLRHGSHEAVDVVAEAHVEHFIGFVEDEGLEAVELDQAALHEVENASRSANDDLGAALQGADLAIIRSTAIDRCGTHAFLKLRQFVDLRTDLHGQLTGRAEDKSLNVTLRAINTLDDGNAEGHGLARAGLGLADDIASGQGHGNGLGLDGGGLLETERFDGF